MDWIEEKITHVNRKIRNLSFRSAIAAYILVVAIAGIVLSYITITICFRWESLIWSRYNADVDFWVYSIKLFNWPFWTQTYANFSAQDETLMLILDTVRVWSPFIYGVAGSIAACLLFYKRRLKTPLDILKNGTTQVRNNNLDIDLNYDSQDEMGQLCHSFEEMRLELIHNKAMMWELVENQKQLNAAFAHDLRTPLTVLKGYSDFLSRYLPQGKLSEEKMLDTLRLMSEHLSRLEQYTRTMKGIRSLDELPLQKENYTVGRIQNEIMEVVFALNQIGDIEIHLQELSDKVITQKAAADGNLILEVLENLLSNSIRFARFRIDVSLSYDMGEALLMLVVWDDGPGFTEYDFQKALLPYYREYHNISDTHNPSGAAEFGNIAAHSKQEKLPDSNRTDCTQDNPHFGIGLHICRKLCTKHGGELSIANSIDGGAVVTASFSCKNE